MDLAPPGVVTAGEGSYLDPICRNARLTSANRLRPHRKEAR